MLVTKLPEAMQRQDEMTKIMGSSLKKMAKKIHNVELIMHNEPENSDTYERKIWQEKLNGLLRNDVAKRLPTLKEIQLANIQEETKQQKRNASRKRIRPKKQPIYMGKNSRKPIATKKSNEQIKPLEGKGLMNTPIEGEVINVLKSYKGLNTSCGDERILRRIDGRHSKLFAKSSLPDWIGPGHYEDAFSNNTINERPPSSYQVSFRNTGRVSKNADHYKAYRLEQLSRSGSAQLDCDSRPSYSASSSCSKMHDVMDESDIICDNPWSLNSAQSTIGRPSSQSGRFSPHNVIIHSPKQSVCAYESVVSDFITLPAELASPNSIGMGNSVNINSLDSLVLVAADVDKRRYENPDFAMGGLDLQQDIPVVTLADLGEVEVDDVANTVIKKNLQHRSKVSEDFPKSRAQKVLKDIRRDLSRNKKSKIRGENISITDSISSVIDDWQSSENFKSPSVFVRQRKNKSHVVADTNAVNLDQLLMDDSGMSFEEAKSLMEEYSESLNFVQK